HTTAHTLYLHSFPTRRSSDLIQIRANRFGALKVADAKTTTSKSFIRGSSSKKRMCLISPLIRSPLFESVFSATVFQEMLQPHIRSEEHTSELQSRFDLVCRLL